MGAATVRDAIAAKVSALSSAQHVYANGSSDPAVAPWPDELVDNEPHALVGRGATVRTGGTGNQIVTRTVDVEWRFPAVDKGEAQRRMDALEDEIVVAFSDGLFLGGRVIDCTYEGSDKPFETADASAREWVVWITHFRARERFAVEMSV